jgi:VIT1/CCC1 family predicted Fe2+/Mn2+ transporter
MKRLMDNKGTRTGFFFGATSGVITTMGLIAGLYAGTDSLVAVLGGIFVVAVSDAMSDALGIHLAQEADPESSVAHIWAATISTFFTKLFVALTFALPLLFLSLDVAVLVSVGWGLIVIVLLSYYLARTQKVLVLPVVVEHLAIAAVVVVIAHFIGVWVQSVFS